MLRITMRLIKGMMEQRRILLECYVLHCAPVSTVAVAMHLRMCQLAMEEEEEVGTMEELMEERITWTV